MRLDKFLCDMGIGSRSDVKKMIRKGAVTVDGAPVKDPGASVSSESAVMVSDQPVRYESFQYYMMNKPAGVISASEDAREKTVVDLLLEDEANVSIGMEKDVNANDRDILMRKRKDMFPVGRLDRDTEGLLIITNDGQLAHQLLSPVHHIDKTYFARVSGVLTEEDVKRFEKGIRFDENLTALPAKLKILSTGHLMEESDCEAFWKAFKFRKGCQEEPSPVSSIPDTYSEIEVTIQEGKFHQIKKMVEALGPDHEVLYLKRISMGPIPLDTRLKPGQARRLAEQEIESLRKQIK